MDERFAVHVEALQPSLRALLNMKPYRFSALPRNMPRRGVYLLSENEINLYVGRSNNIRRRLGRHCNPGATHKSAAFAFRLAREATNRMKPVYAPGAGGTRAELMLESAFVEAFTTSKKRIREMEIRFVEETDPTRPSAPRDLRSRRPGHDVQRFRHSLRRTGHTRR